MGVLSGWERSHTWAHVSGRAGGWASGMAAPADRQECPAPDGRLIEAGLRTWKPLSVSASIPHAAIASLRGRVGHRARPFRPRPQPSRHRDHDGHLPRSAPSASEAPPLRAHRDLACTPRRRRSTRGPQGDARRPVRNPLLTRVLTSTVPASHLGSAPTFGAPVPAVTSATGHRLRATTKRRAPARSAPRRAPVRRPVCSTPRDAHGRTVVLPARHCPAVFRPACPGRGAPDGRRRPRTRPYLPALPRR